MSRIALIEDGVRSLFHEHDFSGFAPTRIEIRDHHLMVYLRLGHRAYARGQGGVMLQLGSIEVFGDNQGKGLKNEVFDFLERFAAERREIAGVYIESVNNKDLIPGLRRRGYEIREGDRPLDNEIGLDWYKLTPGVSAT